MAPGAARIPYLMCAPSSAGPVAQEEEISSCRLPMMSSPFVPMSMISTFSSWLYGASAISTPTLSAPTKPASLGSTNTLAPRAKSSLRSRALMFIEWCSAGAYGAQAQMLRVDPQEAVVHGGVEHDRHLEDVAMGEANRLGDPGCDRVDALDDGIL